MVARPDGGAARVRSSAVDPFGAAGRVVPGVFAHGQRQTHPPEVDANASPSRLEPTVFVEHVVGRKQPFVRAPEDLTAPSHQGGVVDRASLLAFVQVDGAEHQDEPLGDAFDQPLVGGQRGGDEALPVEQVTRRITDDRKLAGDRQLGAERAGALRGREDRRAVLVEGPDRVIELQKPEAHDGSF